jgi:hypothetical protein
MPERPTDHILIELQTTVDLNDALRELGECVHPVILGDPEGYTEKAREFLRFNLCVRLRLCELLSEKGLSSFLDTAAMIADLLHVAVFGVNPQYPAVVVWKVAAGLARFGLPATLGCVPCPMANQDKLSAGAV